MAKRKTKISQFSKIKENIKIIGTITFIFTIIGFILGVYTDVMKVDDLQKDINRLNNKIDNLVELIIANSANKFDVESRAPKLLGEQ